MYVNYTRQVRAQNRTCNRIDQVLFIPGGHIEQLVKPLSDESTNVPAGQGKNLNEPVELSVIVCAKPDCSRVLRSAPFMSSSMSSNSMYSSSPCPTPLDH